MTAVTNGGIGTVTTLPLTKHYKTYASLELFLVNRSKCNVSSDKAEYGDGAAQED
jgi:hypothetical protein